jgi:hypothetical protein
MGLRSAGRTVENDPTETWAAKDFCSAKSMAIVPETVSFLRKAARNQLLPGIAQVVEGTCGIPDWLIPIV